MKKNGCWFAGSIALFMTLTASSALAAPTLPELEAKAAETKTLMEKVHAAKADVDVSEHKILDLVKDIAVKKATILAINHDGRKEDRIQKRDQGQSQAARDAYDVLVKDRVDRIAALDKLIQQNEIAIENESEKLKEKKSKLKQAKTDESNSEKTLRSMAKEIHDANCGKRDLLQKVGLGISNVLGDLKDVLAASTIKDERELRRIQNSALCSSVSAVNDRTGGVSPNRTPAGPIESDSIETVASSESAR